MPEIINIEAERKEILTRYKNLLGLCKPFLIKGDLKYIREASEIALEAFKEKRNVNGDPYIFTSFEIAGIVIEELGLGKVSIVSSLLYKAYEEKRIPKDLIVSKFGLETMAIIEGVNTISAITSSKLSLQSDNLKQFLLTLAKDVRVLLLKLAIRTFKMRNINFVAVEYHDRIALEATHLYAPLAHQMGLYNLKGELEDLAMKISKPDIYKNIDKRLQETQLERQGFISNFIDPIKNELLRKKLKADVKWRTKRVNSIYRKMKKQNVEFDEVYDKFAIRIILDSKPDNEKSDCWRAYSIVSDIYAPNPKRLRDWISIPKSTGYESLHTTVMGPGGRWVEVQIRTKRMDEIAEKGLAAHWRYKGVGGEKELDKLLTGIREIIEQPDINAADVVDSFQMDVFSDEIFVFTPKGDLKKLPKGSTVLDFAFDIHTEVGAKCVSAKINHKVVPIKYVLNNGDQISIITSNNQKPKPDWLNIVVTSKAKSRIKKLIDEEKYKLADTGKEIIKRKFRNWKIKYDDAVIRKVIKFYKFKNAQDFYCSVANEEIDTLGIKAFLLAETREELPRETEIKDTKVTEKEGMQGEDFKISDNNLSGLDYRIAQCCNPQQGDKIVGFVTIGQGISVHKALCNNAMRMRERYSYREIDVSWNVVSGSFSTEIRITGKDRLGIVGDISSVVSKDLNLNIISISVDTNKGAFDGKLKVFVEDQRHLDILLQRLLKIEGVEKVIRSDSE